MILYTERLILRPWDISEAQTLFDIAKDPKVGPDCGWPPHQNIDESLYVIENVFNSPECYAVCLKEDNIPIGTIEIKLKGRSELTDREDECELGFWLASKFWGQGIMPEATREIIRHAFEDLGLKKIWISHHDKNDKSRRAQEKAGFKYDHTIYDSDMPLLGCKRNKIVNVMTREDYDAVLSSK